MAIKEKKVLFIIPQTNFRDEELIEPRRILESNKIRTLTANSTGKTSNGMLGSKIEPNLTLDKVNVNDFDAIIFIGGSGSTAYYTDKTAINIAKEAYLKGKIVASICLASGVLAIAGLLKGKNATGFETTKELIEKNGGIYKGTNIEISNRIITARDPQSAKEFGEAILKALEVKKYED